jgi:hypothetical protein
MPLLSPEPARRILLQTRTRANTNPIYTEASAAGRREVRVCSANGTCENQEARLAKSLAKSEAYPAIITALDSLYRTIMTNSLIPVTTPLTTTILEDVAVPLSSIPQGQSSIRPVEISVWCRLGLLWQNSPGVPSGVMVCLRVLARTGRRNKIPPCVHN